MEMDRERKAHNADLHDEIEREIFDMEKTIVLQGHADEDKQCFTAHIIVSGDSRVAPEGNADKIIFITISFDIEINSKIRRI